MADATVRSIAELAPGKCWRALAPQARFSLRVDLEAAAARLEAVVPASTETCRARTREAWAALWLGPDEQLLIGPEQDAARVAAAISGALQGIVHSLVDIGHRQGAIEVAGPAAAALINSECPLDLRLSAFPAGSCTRTVFAKAEIVLWRLDEQRFHVEAWRSFLPYVGGLLAEAEREHQR
jgi:sarcosine oxidase subunit gamma